MVLMRSLSFSFDRATHIFQNSFDATSPSLGILSYMKKLEEYRGFPIIAWAVIVFFSLFTVNLAFDFEVYADELYAGYEIQE